MDCLLAYVSKARLPAGEQDRQEALRHILRSARPHNAAHGITGYLTWFDGRFLQVLEGSEQALKVVMLRIRADRRHTDITIVAARSRWRRRFSGWDMGCTIDAATLRASRAASELYGRLRLDATPSGRLIDFLQTLSVIANRWQTEMAV